MLAIEICRRIRSLSKIHWQRDNNDTVHGGHIKNTMHDRKHKAIKGLESNYK